MKLRNKLLSILPLATLGITTPIAISSCSCGNGYQLEFGKAINCKDNKVKTPEFHSINDIKNAAKSHVQVTPENEDVIEWSDSKESQEFIFWDLVYSMANKNIGFILTWNFKNGTQLLENGNIDGNDFTSVSYRLDNRVWKFNFAGVTEVESYARSLHHQ